MATSLIGPCWVERASPAAPVPRPPQPTRATRIVLSSAAWTDGTATPARADAPATWPVVLRKLCRDVDGWGSVIGDGSRGRDSERSIRRVGWWAEEPALRRG